MWCDVPVIPAVRRVLAPGLAACLGAAGVVAAGGLVVGLVVVGSTPAQAARPCPDPTLDQDIAHAHVVFRGEVTKVRPVQNPSKPVTTRTYHVTADRVYKSSLVQDQVVVTALVGTRCALPTLRQNTRYIFFVTEHRTRLLATSGTAPATARLTHQVVKRLGNGAQPEVTPPAAAQFTRVADATPPALSRLLAPGAALLIVSILGLLLVGRRGRRTA
ncbi:MAG: hypothetical protein WAV00_07515 [Nocardioides sp.]